MKVQVDFYGEAVTMPLPQTYSKFKNLIGHYYVLPEADVDELIFFFDFNGSKNALASEEDYKKLVNRPKGFPIKIFVEVNEKSKLFKAEEQKIIDLDKGEEYDEKEKDYAEMAKDYAGKAKEMLINQREYLKELWNNQGGKAREMINAQGARAKEIINTQGAKAKEMINYQGEKAMELWNNHGGKVMELWNNIKLTEKIEVVKGKCGEAYQKIQENIPYFKPEEKKEEPVVHKSHRCDGCRKFPIVGTRFKCTICNDFDFCSACEEKHGESHNHPFLKIRKPSYAPIEIKCHIYHK